MNKFVMLCGLSGCGKSTVADEYKREGYEVFSSDEIREELWGDAADQQNPQKVFDILHKRCLEALMTGKDCVYDATNLNAKRRKHFLRMIQDKRINCYKICHLFAVSVEVCIKRDFNRDRSVGAEVIQRQLRQFEVPYYNEGWDEIELILSEHEGSHPEFLNFRNTIADKHDNPHHSLSISDHMEAAAEYVSKKMTERDVWFAARYHDYGKYFTKSFKDRKGNEIEYAHYYNHQNVGAYYFLWIYGYYSRNTSYLLKVAFLIQHHMDHYLRDEKSMGKFYEEIGEEMAAKLKLLEEADIAAH